MDRTALEDDAIAAGAGNLASVTPQPGEPENGEVDFSIITMNHARRLLKDGATAEEIAAATNVCLSRCVRFVEEEPEKMKAREEAAAKAVTPEPEKPEPAKKKATKNGDKG